MKNKTIDVLFVGINLLIVILLFTIFDHMAHGLEGAWSVPDYYFRNKIPFGFLWAIVGYFFTRKIENIWLKSLILSCFVGVILQTRYFLEGYPLDFVLIFLVIHSVILFILSVIMYKVLGSLYKNNQSVSMKNFIIVLVVLVIVVVGVYYLVFNNQGGSQNVYAPTESAMTQATPTESSVATVAPTGASAPADMSVSISGFKFNPAQLTVKAGTKVTWTNQDSVPHTVTSDSENVLNSPRLSQGQSFSFTFTTPGTYAYHCEVHPMMRATVVVTN
ncbi:MAG: cupredoxin family copper-binding protein [Candidatus Pacebacteria bacterium]|nr:cupredoxin family copper-binding protein [Candidatus Paceibacterota bacterium]